MEVIKNLDTLSMAQCMLVCRRWQLLLGTKSAWSNHRKIYLRGFEGEVDNKFVLFFSKNVFLFVRNEVNCINIAQTKDIFLPLFET